MTQESLISDQAASAAVMLMLLEDNQAAQILSRFEPDELGRIGERMCALGEIGPEAISRAISGFVERTQNLGLGGHDRIGQVQSLMTRAVGEMKAGNLMQRIAPDRPRHSPLEIVKWLTPDVIAPLIENEHPQAIAVLLVQLDPETAAQVLHRLPEAMQPDVVHRIATLGPVTGEALEMLEELLNRRIGEAHGAQALSIGGPRDAAEIMNSSGKAVEKRVMPAITKRDKALAKEIESEMFKFEHLFELDPQAMGALLREVDSETLIDALKGIAEDERELFFRAMSSRAADGVKDEIAARGRIKIAEVVAAQKQVVEVAKRLADDGTLIFGSGDDEYV